MRMCKFIIYHMSYISLLNYLIYHRLPHNVTIPQLVTIKHVGKVGRPQKDIDPLFLQQVMDPRISISQSALARALHMDRKTLAHCLKRHGIDYSFSQISDANLDEHVKQFKKEHPDSGIRYLIGALRKNGLKIQRHRVYQTMQRVDQIGLHLRKRRQRKAKITRVSYQVSRPNALWHMDGHHKLIRWGIVIHGCVDGYSRMVQYIYTEYSIIILTSFYRLLA